MTNKKRRQRGSRTHGGGTHKNRRGAGNRGGRGRAGRKGHEKWNYPSLGKSGFKRPQKTDRVVLEVKLQKLDEDATLYVADGLAEEEGDGYAFDARDVVEDGYDADAVKVLGGGQVRKELHVVADDFSESAREQIEAAGGTAELSERAQQAEEETETDAEDESEA
jgi:large subunit ribosomal protein L15